MRESNPISVVRAAWEAWDRRDMAALFDLYDDELVWDMAYSDVADMGAYRGHAGVRHFFKEWFQAFDDYYAVAEGFTLAGEGVVVEVRQGGRGKGSGVVVEMPRYWQVYTVHDGKITRVEVYRNEEAALRRARGGATA